jgi:hypothetical protein
MVGDKYWSTGITLKSDGIGLWVAECKFFDSGFVQSESTEGVLISRYYAPLEIVIDNVKADVEKLGIDWREPTLYGHGDGEDEEWPMPPNWKTIIKEQCNRIGWNFIYLSNEELKSEAENG